MKYLVLCPRRMRKKAMTNVWTGLILVVLFSVVAKVICLKDGDCLDQRALGYFLYSPGGYDPLVGMDGIRCSSLCSGVSLPYAGVQDGAICLCAKDSAVEELAPVEDTHCELDDAYTTFYKSHVFTLIEGLSINPTKETVLVGEPVEFELFINKGADVDYQMDFGDGSGTTRGNVTEAVKHVYRIPGRYYPVVSASIVGLPEMSPITAATEVTVVSGVAEEDVDFDCPMVMEPDDRLWCNLTIRSGVELKMDIDFGDGTVKDGMALPDVPIRGLGISIPDKEVMEMEQNPQDATIYVIPDAKVEENGIIKTIRGYGMKEGEISVLILRPTCPKESCENEEDSRRVMSCQSSHVFCSHAGTCLEAEVEKPCPWSSNFLQDSYTVAETIPVEVQMGYFEHKLQTPQMIMADDLIGFQSKGGQLAYRRREQGELPDLMGTSGLQGNTLSTSNLNDDDMKVYLQVLVTEPLFLPMPHTYGESGNYDIKISIENPYAPSKIDRLQSISVQSIISDIKLVVTPENNAVGEETEIKVHMKGGSDVTMTWDYGDGTVEEDHIPLIRTNQKFTKTHIFKAPGTYLIQVHAINMQSALSVNHTLIAQHPVSSSWKVVTNSPQLLPGFVQVNLTYPITEPLPTAATAVIALGDGTVINWAVPEKDFHGAQTLLHEYRKTGIYHISVTISNLVTQKTFRADVDVASRIVGLTVKALYTPTGNWKDLRPGLGTDNERFPINKKVKFFLEAEAGDVEMYMMEHDGVLLKNSTVNEIVYVFKEAAAYNLTFYAYNHIQKKSEPAELAIYTMQAVGGLDIVDKSNDTFEPELKRLQLNFESLGTDTCLLIDLDDKSRNRVYGTLSTCLLKYNREDIFLEGELTNPQNIRLPYSKPGAYNVYFHVFNDISEMTMNITLNVVKQDCKPPKLVIKNGVSVISEAPIVWRSKPVQLYTLTTVDCNITTHVTRVWFAYLLDEVTGEEIDQVDLSPLDSYRKSFLYVPPFFLQKGIYKFRFQVNVSSPVNHPRLPYRETVDTIIKVIPSPIIGRLLEGAQSRITRGWGQSLVLEPGFHSIDPDDENNKDFNVTWFCKRLPNEDIDRSVPDDMQNKSSPIFDRRRVYVDPPDNFDELDEEQLAELEQVPDLGGCFGEGPGMIDIEGGNITMTTTVFRKPNETYEILIRIDAPTREKPSWAGLQLVLLERSPPVITVECQTKPLCYPNDPIGQKINPVRVGLIGKCSEGCEGTLYFEWQIIGVDNGTEVELPEANEYLYGAYEQKMALSEEFFKEYYPAFGDFIAKLMVTNEEGDQGVADLFLHINKPPEGGDCTMTPTEGRALLDKFYVTCYGWIDPEGLRIEFYAFWIQDLSLGVTSYLMYGPDKESWLILPYGDLMLGVDIRDKEGALTKFNISVISTQAPTKQEYDQFMYDKHLDNADAAGDQARMNQVSQAISSLMNIELYDENAIYDTPENASLRAAEPSENEIKDVANTKMKMVRSVGSIMNADTLTSLEQIGSAITAIAGEGETLDNTAKELIIQLLNKTVNMASTMTVEAPQQLLDFCMYAVGSMGGIVQRMTQQIIKGVVLPTDREKAWDIDYNVEAPLEGEEEEYIFDGKSSLEESLNKAVIQNERIVAEGQINKMVTLTIELVLSMLRHIVVGEKPMEFASPSGLALTIAMFQGGGLSNRSIKHGDAIYVFPHVCDILVDNCMGNETLGVLAVSWPAILQSYGDGVDVLSEDTKTMQLMMLNETLHIMKIQNTTDMFNIFIPRKSSKKGEKALPDPNHVTPHIKWNEQMVYHQFVVEKADSAVNIEITPTNPDAELIAYMKHRVKPMFNSFDLLIPLKNIRMINDTYDIFLSNEVINNRTGFFYLGIIELNTTWDVEDELIEVDNATLYSGNFTVPGLSREFTTNYSLRIFTSGCYFFNSALKIWSGQGCYVENSNQAVTHCKCNHLTSFGGGFFVMPNTVDFAYVFANAGFADNVTIYMTIIVTFLIYIMLVIWARREDKKDLEKLGAVPLPDNDPQDRYLYEITVFTGDKEGAGTDSKVCFILSGDDDETEVREFGDPNRKIFRRAAVDSFVMSVPRCLGRLNYLRIWHDNSGKGKFRSWYLSFILVQDIQTGQKFEFIANKWFAVEKGDGQIDRLLPVAGKGEATEFTHLFQLTTQKNLADGHLWFSIFMRPPKSRFTRVQRVSCCMSLLYLSMLVNAMWYGRVPPKPKSSSLDIGPFSLSPEQIGVGVMANIIVFPPTFLMITLFRKSRLRTLRPSRITQALKKQAAIYQKRGSSPFLARPGTSDSTSSLVPRKDENRQHKKMMETTNKKKKKKRFLFPWWCRYIAWALCLSSMGVSVFFLWAYGVQFGDEKTKKWVTSLLVSFFTSVLVTQPIKVFLTAMIISSLCKSVDNGSDDSEEDEEQPEIDLLPDEEWLHTAPSAKERKRKLNLKLPNFAALESARLERLKEMKMNKILKEIFSYLFFLWILTVLSYGNRDPSAFMLRENLENTFIKGGGIGDDFNDVKYPAQFWNWTRTTLIPHIQVGDWYNGYKPFGLRGFIEDRANRIMGYGVLRQVRAKPNTCKVNDMMKNITPSCSGYSNMINEDRNSYTPGWADFTDSEDVDEWHYQKASKLNGLPFWGKLDVYGGGGYVMPLRGGKDPMKQRTKELEVQNWIDARTRAVFAEFSVYNAQVNLFGVVTIIAEFQPGGGIIPNHRIEAIRLMRYHQGFGLFVMICEITYVAFTIYFTIREIKNIRTDRAKYFKSYWNWMEMWVIGLSYAGITMYIYRMIVTNRILKIFDRSHGNGYVKLQYVAAVDEVFGYIVAFTIFIAILKFIKLLRFNKRMGVLYITLAQCSKDLKSFCVVFLIVFLSFVQVFYLIFGTQLLDFSSFVSAAESSFGMATGSFDFDAMCMAAPLLGPIFFLIFAWVTSVILINIFLTLIISAFETVKGDLKKQKNEFEIVDFMLRKFKGMVGIVDRDGGDNYLHPDSERTTMDDKINGLPEKVDKLLDYINDVYFEGQLDVDNKSALKDIYAKSEEMKKKGRAALNAKETPRQMASTVPSVFDWMEVEEDPAKLTKF